MTSIPVSITHLLTKREDNGSKDDDDSDSELESSLTIAAASWIFLRPKGIFYAVSKDSPCTHVHISASVDLVKHSWSAHHITIVGDINRLFPSVWKLFARFFFPDS